MRERVDSSMWKAAHGETISENVLQDYLDDWGLYGADMGLQDDVFDWWIIWRRSNYVVLPFQGGWLDQPWWIRADFLTLDLVRQYHEIQSEKPSIDHLVNPLDEFDT